MPCIKTKTKTTIYDPCAGLEEAGCTCAVAACKSAESAAASAASASRSANLAQHILKNCLTDGTILEDGGLKYVEADADAGTAGGIAIDEDWLTDWIDEAGGTSSGSGPTYTPGAGINISDDNVISSTVTDITGNSGTATKLATARTIALTGDATGSGTFDGSADLSISTTLASSGVTAGSYGPSANATAEHGGTISVPQITVDAKGRVTSASSRTITLPSLSGDISGNIETATKLATARTIALTGDATGSGTFDGSADLSISTTLASSGVTAGSYGPSANATAEHGGTISVPQVTVDAKGRVTSASSRTITLPSAPTDVTGNAATATKLATARTIQTNLASTSAASFDGSANVTPGVTGILPIANGGTGNSTGLAASATQLATARTIRTNLASTSTASFDGTANITPGVTGILPIANGGTGNSTGNAATATALATARTISLTGDATGSTTFDGSQDVSIATSVPFYLPVFFACDSVSNAAQSIYSAIPAGKTTVSIESVGADMEVAYWGSPTESLGLTFHEIGASDTSNDVTIQVQAGNSASCAALAGKCVQITLGDDVGILTNDGTAMLKFV